MESLAFCKQDEGDLKRFLQREDIKELPGPEEMWEVPEPLEIKPESLGKSLVEHCLGYQKTCTVGAVGTHVTCSLPHTQVIFLF